MKITLSTPIQRTPRVQQVEGLFDLPPTQQSHLEWDVALPLEEKPWNIGLIVGPSGSGKSTVARHLFGEALQWQEQLPDWPKDCSVVDAFPAEMSIKEVTALLSSVGFSSPPAWLRPFHVLSTGEQFRVTLARLLACCYSPVADAPGSPNTHHAPRTTHHDLVVMDEYTSVVDRTVAQIGSAALAKTVRRRGQKFIAVSCHEDVEAWLQPDWTYRPATNTFAWRFLQRRPPITLEIARVHHSAWQLFRPHHYLNTSLHKSAVCFVAFWQRRPVAFSAWLPAMTRNGGKREHRTVTLPDYQGVGIGHQLSNFCAAYWKSQGHRAVSTTTHPAFVAARLRDPCWRMIRAPSLGGRGRERRNPKLRHAVTRLTAGFEYVGPPSKSYEL